MEDFPAGAQARIDGLKGEIIITTTIMMIIMTITITMLLII